MFTDGTSITRSTGNIEPETWSWPAATGASDHFPVLAELHY
jgi:endonuclease/exonuclease/phosphatase family metal-dependent hydrolase